jgi:hypothetical protein
VGMLCSLRVSGRVVDGSVPGRVPIQGARVEVEALPGSLPAAGVDRLSRPMGDGLYFCQLHRETRFRVAAGGYEPWDVRRSVQLRGPVEALLVPLVTHTALPPGQPTPLCIMVLTLTVSPTSSHSQTATATGTTSFKGAGSGRVCHGAGGALAVYLPDAVRR